MSDSMDPTRERIVPDPEERGLYTRIRSSGHQTYVVLYRFPASRMGRLSRITIGKPSEVAIEDARQIARFVRNEIENDRDPRMSAPTELSSIQAPNIPVIGLYLLINRKRIVYVGKSRTIMVRISQHLATRKIPFDDYCYLHLPEPRIAAAERTLIDLLRPEHNDRGNPRP